MALQQAGRLPEAEQQYKAVLEAAPDNPDAYHLLGLIAHQVGQLELADQLIGKAVSLDGNKARYQYNHGVVLQALERHADAVAAYRRAIRLQPNDRAAFENLGVALVDSGEPAAAEKAYLNAIRLEDCSPLGRHNLGALLRDRGDLEAARAQYERALELHPAYPEARLKLAQCQLASGELPAGWEGLEWRAAGRDAAMLGTARSRPYPVFPGRGRRPGTILVTAEQGIGDEILFASCVPDLVAVAEACVLECEPRLVPLFARSFPAATVVPSSSSAVDIDALASFDWRLPAGSLMRHFRRELDDFSTRDGYLVADEQQRTAFRQQLDALGRRLNVGLSWRGGAERRARQARSLSLAAFDWLLGRDDVSVIDLQYGDHGDEIARHGEALVRVDGIDPLQELDRFAALVSELDLVISVDNSTVHMAGALGVPCWVLVPTTGEWRWFGPSREESAWYASLRLFHQQKTGDWSTAMRSLSEAFEAFSPSRRRPAGGSSAGVAPPPAVSPTVLLLNDTSSWYHWGCSCTSVALHDELRRRHGPVDAVPIQQTAALPVVPRSAAELDDDRLFEQLSAACPQLLERMSAAERIVINGEGSIHGSSTAALGLLYLAWLAGRRLGKAVEIINHSCYPSEEHRDLYERVYRAVDRVAIREPVSADIVRAMGVDVVESFDCLPLFVERHYAAGRPEREKRVVIAGSVAADASMGQVLGDLVGKLAAAGYDCVFLLGAAANPASEDFAFAKRLNAQAPGDFRVVYAASETEWLALIASSRLLVSGRFHHSIAAAWLGTPVLTMASNTRKIEGLSQRLGLDMLAPGEPDALYDRARDLLGQPERLDPATRSQLLELAGKNFD